MDNNAEEVANLFMVNMFKFWKLLRDIIGDLDTRFTK